jgi:beta-N-acetylhexosaminidase
MVCGACRDGGNGDAGNGGASNGGASPPTVADDPATREAARAVPNPPCQPAPLESRAATVLVVGIGDATSAGAPLPARVSALGVGGVIVLRPNVVDATQLRALIQGLRQRSPRRLLVTVDEEGGRVSRLRPVLGTTPPARTLGQRPLAEIAEVAAGRGARLRDLGFDVSFAPVVDADGGPSGAAIGDRSFAASPAEAGSRAGAFAEGLRRTGVAPTAKHFPGQGGLADSHDGRVLSDRRRDQLECEAAAGFRPAFDAGVPAVMMSHVTFTALGPLPASLEPGAYRLLRSFGFQGVAVTDAMGMSAITAQWSIPQAAAMAVAAGADLVLANQGDQATAMRDAIVASVRDGRLPEARLDEAVSRVLALRGENPATMVCR